MIDLYYWPTPNGWKASIMLEECGLPYTLVPVNIGQGDQFKPEFLAISPNNRMPAIVDHDVDGDPVPVFESGAILLYLAEKTGKLMPRDPLGRKDVRDLVLSLRDEGKTIFFSSHILADAEMICDQVAIIVNGRIVHQGYLDELLGQEISGIEVVAEGISEAVFDELSREAQRAVVQGSRFQFDFDDEAAAEKALDRVRESGGRIRSLVPRRRSLEDLFVAEARKEARS